MSIGSVLWDYGLAFLIVGVSMILILRMYSTVIISDVQENVRKFIIKPFILLSDDVDKVIDEGSSVYIELPDMDFFYTVSNITSSGSVVESLVTGDKFDYTGDIEKIKKDLKGLISDGFSVYLKRAYDEMVSFGFEICRY